MKRKRWEIFPDELYQGLKIILPFIVGGIAMLFGAMKWPYPTGILVMIISVGFLVYTRKWFE
jgi:thiosulfate reductase cytochrome b subunit